MDEGYLWLTKDGNHYVDVLQEEQKKQTAVEKIVPQMQEILVKGRRTFCSDLCVHEHRLRSNIDYMRQNVFKRDSGVCSECLLDCVQLAKQISTMSL